MGSNEVVTSQFTKGIQYEQVQMLWNFHQDSFPLEHQSSDSLPVKFLFAEPYPNGNWRSKSNWTTYFSDYWNGWHGDKSEV